MEQVSFISKKLLLVGDKTGDDNEHRKTCLLTAMDTGRAPTVYVSSVYDGSGVAVKVDGKHVSKKIMSIC